MSCGIRVVGRYLFDSGSGTAAWDVLLATSRHAVDNPAGESVTDHAIRPAEIVADRPARCGTDAVGTVSVPFPRRYITRWARGFRQAISHEQLHAAIAGHQALQQCCDDVARNAPTAFRLLLKMLAFSIKALYFVTFRVLRRVVTSQIAQAGATQTETAQKT